MIAQFFNFSQSQSTTAVNNSSLQCFQTTINRIGVSLVRRKVSCYECVVIQLSTFVIADTTIALYCILYKRFYNVLIAFESHGLVGKRFCFHCTKTKQFDSLLHLPLCTEEFAADFCLVGLKDCSHVSRMVSF